MHFPTCTSTFLHQPVDTSSHRPQLDPTVRRGITSESADCVFPGPRPHADCKPDADTTCSVIHIAPVSVLTNDRDVINVSERSSTSVVDGVAKENDLRGGLIDPRPLSCESSNVEHDGRTSVHKKRLSVAERRTLKSKPKKVQDDAVNIESEALRGYELFHGLPRGSATLQQVVASSAGTLGWSRYAKSYDVVAVIASAGDDKRESQQRDLLQKMGILDEVARKHVSFGDDSRRAGIHLFEVVDPIADHAVLSAENWVDIEFEVALDSGSQDHVCDEQDCPGYVTEVSPGSSRGQCFIVGDGGKLPNQGQRQLNMQPMGDATVDMRSCFQIARVTRPFDERGQDVR